MAQLEIELLDDQEEQTPSSVMGMCYWHGKCYQVQQVNVLNQNG